jgi:ribonuclease HI
MKVFTDGACSSNGKALAKAGCGVYFQDTQEEFSLPLKEAMELCGITGKISNTNNTGEMMAILCALNLIKDKTQEVAIYTDSMYSINCISIWLKAWKKNNWKTTTGKDVKNQSIIKAIDKKKSEFKSVIFIYVKAHTLEPEDKCSYEHSMWLGNYTADNLATSART